MRMLIFALAALFAPSAFAAETAVTIDLNDNSIVASPAELKAGPIIFTVKNDSLTETHEMVVVKGDETKQPLPFDSKRNRILEDKVDSLGEVSQLAPGQSKTLKLTLAKGSYTLLCNIKGHYHDGMHMVVTVD